MKRVITLSIIGIFALISASAQDVFRYKNPVLTVEERTQDLLGHMTLEEKAGQLLCPLGWEMYEKRGADVTCSAKFKELIRTQHVGMFWAVYRADPWTKKTLETGLNPELAAKAGNALQKYVMENTRLGIPLFLAEECPHGHMAIGATVFPVGIAMASTWNTALVEQVAAAIAKEVRSQGGHIGYGPVLDLARDPRWSRVEEGYGEDPVLSARMGAAIARGHGGGNISDPNSVISTIKHFIAYGIPEGGHNGNTAFIGERELHENFLPPFKATIDAGALSVMTAYNSIDGIPCTANSKLLTDLLKNQWNFRGFVVSDLISIDGIHETHRVATDMEEAAVMALTAGVDVDLGANAYVKLIAAVKQNRISEAVIDSAVCRVLRLKFEMGLFENPYVDPLKARQTVRNAGHVDLAREAARQAVVLLENKNQILPLNKNLRNVAVIGPNAYNTYNQLGDYTAPQEGRLIETVLDGIKAKLPETQIEYVKGCAIRDTTWQNIDRAVTIAQEADVAIVVVGGSSARDFKTRYIETGAAVTSKESISDIESGEGFDRATLDLLGKQLDLLQAVKATGTPVIVIYIQGRPLNMNWASEHADALLTAWYPGQEGGHAIADVLFGDYNPAGRLPISVPRSVGQIPVYYNKKNPRGHDYVEITSLPLYAFGYGLSYTQFEYKAPQTIQTAPYTYEVTFTLQNSGPYAGDEVVQLYIKDEYASVVQPIMQLRHFERIHLKAGEQKQVTFRITADDLSIVNMNMERVVEPGSFSILIGSSSDDIKIVQQIRVAKAGFTKYVDPYIGTDDHGHVFLGANVPFGLVQLGPTNITEGWDWCSGYHYSDSTIFGFSHMHLSGTGIGDLCDILVMPVTGNVKMAKGTVDHPSSGMYSLFDRKRESVRPGYYSVHLDRYHIDVELTATKRVGFHKYTFPETDSAAVVFNLADKLNWDEAVACYINQENDSTISGYRYSKGWAKDQRIFFAAVFSKPIKEFQVYDSLTVRQGSALQDRKVYGKALFDALGADPLYVKVALSPVSIENAKENMLSELPGWNFYQTVSEADDAWNAELNKIQIETPDESVKRIFYTALYHTMIAPSEFCDVNGDYYGADLQMHKGEGFVNYTTFSLWDTYRAAHPLMTLIHPEKMSDMIHTMLNIYRQQGKLPVWHLVGNETDCMVGNPAISVVADAILKGYEGFDKELAYEAMKTSAMLDERGLKFLKEYGYIPYDKDYPESVAKCMEYAIAGWSLAQVARQMDKREDYAYFLERSKAYRYYFDKETRFMRGLSSDGKFRTPFNPFESAHFDDDYCEGNAWQYTWLVPHDVEGLVDLFGGKADFIQKLDSLFIVEGSLGKSASPDVSGLIGQYAHGNEPSHHVLYLYAYVGQPWKTAEKVRQVLYELYHDQPAGLSGNEDVGQMSAWYILSSLGFYQVEPAGGKYVLGSPIVDKAVITVKDGKQFTITVKNNSKANKYIQAVTLNGKPYDKWYINFHDIIQGGDLQLEMGAAPSETWVGE